jgi:hypothetical protein
MLTKGQIRELGRVAAQWGELVRVGYRRDGSRTFMMLGVAEPQEQYYKTVFETADFDEFIRRGAKEPSLPDLEITDAMEAKLLECAKTGLFGDDVDDEIFIDLMDGDLSFCYHGKYREYYNFNNFNELRLCLEDEISFAQSEKQGGE